MKCCTLQYITLYSKIPYGTVQYNIAFKDIKGQLVTVVEHSNVTCVHSR